MVERLSAYISQQHLLPPDGQEVLLAVSGGRDSVCMARLLHLMGVHFAVAHCNFGLRLDECDRDEAFVRHLAEDYGADFHVERYRTRAYATEHGMSVEEAARELRYDFFARLCRRHGYPCVATAHHQDDSIETFFLNLFRGTGLAGLRGIRPVADIHGVKVVRPMLVFSRADIDAYVQRNELPYVEDSTNRLADIHRNRLRLQLMPMLQEFYPAVQHTMKENIERLSETYQVYADCVNNLRQKLLRPYNSVLPTISVPISALDLEEVGGLMPKRTLLFELLRPYGVGADMVDDIILAMDHVQGQVFATENHRLTLHRNKLLIAPNTQPLAPSIGLQEVSPDSCLLASSPEHIFVDADKVKMPLQVRLWQRGDRFFPFGMDHRRLVSDFLTGLHLCRLEKEQVWLLLDATGRVVWVVGLRADNRFRVDPLTSRVLRITVEPTELG